MSQTLLNFAVYCLRGVHDDTRVLYSTNHAVVRHSSPFVFYQKFSTTVPISIFGLKGSLPLGRRIFLQRRGWRTGLLGWTVGAVLGGNWGKDVEITPVTAAPSLADVPREILSPSARAAIEKELSAVKLDVGHGGDTTTTNSLALLETAVCHVPARSGDGYFRIRVTGPNAAQTIVTTPTFRILSSSLSCPSPRGATLFQLPIELFAATSVTTAQVGAWGMFLSFFFFLSWVSRKNC